MALALSVALSGAALAEPFEDGLSAYGRGDYATALRLWSPLARQGDAHAQFNLGLMYDSGRGVPRDDIEAVAWYRLAADQGVAPAQSNLGLMYAEGRGVPQDLVQAHMWVNLAASRFAPGAPRDIAIRNRDLVAARMTSAQIAEAQRLAREWDAAHPAAR